MTSQRNFLVGVASSGWTALVGLLAVPWYIRYLGIESYGMIGVYLTLQNLFVLLDLGLSPTVSREIARASVEGNLQYARNLVRSMSVIFVTAGVLVSAILVALSPLIASRWLNAAELPPGDVLISIALSAVTVGARWPATLYSSVLYGARRADIAGGITMVTTTVASLGAVLVLAWVESSLRAFFVWQIVVGIVHSAAMGNAARRALGGIQGRFEWMTVRSIWRFSAAMAGVATTGILFSQIDKIVLIRTTTLDQIAHYTIATSLSGMLYRLITPVFNVVYPELSTLAQHGSSREVSSYYISSTRRFLGYIFPVAMLLVVCATPILTIWIGDPDVVAPTSTLVVLLTSGTALHCAMYFPYSLQLAQGALKVPLTINLILSAIFFPAVIVLSSSYGVLGAASAWLILHSLYFVLCTRLTAPLLPPGGSVTWVTRSVAPPLLVSICFGLLAFGMSRTTDAPIAQLAIGVLCAIGSLATGVFVLRPRPSGASA